MRQIVLYIATSLDGYIAKKDGSVDWLSAAGNIDDYNYRAFYDSVDTILIGRRTYDQILSFGSWPYAGKTCYVFSKKNRKANPDVTFSKDPVRRTRKLLKKRGKDIWLLGGADILTTFLKAKLVDSMIITVLPIILGEGIPLFSQSNEVTLKLNVSQSYSSGCVQLHYAV